LTAQNAKAVGTGQMHFIQNRWLMVSQIIKLTMKGLLRLFSFQIFKVHFPIFMPVFPGITTPLFRPAAIGEFDFHQEKIFPKRQLL
jgi:hypothetical protein